MKCYHRTSAAAQILAEGFRDGTGSYLTRELHTGVWISDLPLDANEGALGEELLEVEIPEELFVKYEWVSEPSYYRESLIPAALLNAKGRVRLPTQEEEGEIADDRFGAKL